MMHLYAVAACCCYYVFLQGRAQRLDGLEEGLARFG
jgi:hypothetical protein